MARNPKKKGMTLRRIILMEMVLLFVAQTAITFIGLYNADSINRSIHTHSRELMVEQFTQNITVQLNDINNLLLFLNTKDISYYFQNYMNLKDESGSEKQIFLEKLDELHLSSDVVKSVYFIGNNINQKALHKVTGNKEAEEFTDLRMETFQKAQLEDYFLRSQNQFIRYTMDDFMAVYKPDKLSINQSEKTELEKFLRGIDGRLVIGNMIGDSFNNVFFMIELNDKFFQNSIAKLDDSRMAYSAINSEGRILWSTSQRPELLQSIAAGQSAVSARDGDWSHIRREIPPFNLQVICSENQTAGFLKQSGLLRNMLLVALGTLMSAFIFSFFYLKIMLKPFRRISRAIDLQLGTDAGEITFQPITAKPGRFHTISLRNKLAILFCVVIVIIVSSNSILYLRFLDKEVNKLVTDSVDDAGRSATAGVNNQIRYFENLSNQMSLSTQFQNYLLDTPPRMMYIRPLEIFPGLSDIAYFVLMDSNGSSLYSSIYSNNNDIFSIPSSQLLNRNEPYWVLNNKFVLNNVFAAVLRKMKFVGRYISDGYLLIVPKESAFRIAETERFIAAYTIRNTKGQILYSQRSMAEPGTLTGYMRFQQRIEHTDWILDIDYLIPDVLILIKSYQNQFLYSILVIFLCSLVIVMRISGFLTRSLKQIRDEMRTAESESEPRQLDFDMQDEISGIISSYNSMIVRLEEIVQANMNIMEENARNKIREKELLSMKARAEMNMLQAQINPHFLYNTLSAINMKSLRQANTDISNTVKALSELLRYSMNISLDTAPLAQEINHAANYITIQQICFGNIFSANFDIAREVYDCPVPRIILQPLIENAIQHGFEGWKSGGEILISARRNEDMLEIRISDNGVGMDSGTLEELKREMTQELTSWKADGGGIGLRNVYHRLKLRYQDNSHLSIKSALMEGTEISIILPVVTD